MVFNFSTMDLIRLVSAVLVCAGGALALSLFMTRIRRREFSLLYLGLGASMYAIRLLLQALHQDGGTVDLLITLLIPIPLVLFIVDSVAPDWQKAAWWVIAADLAVAVFALATRLLHMGPNLATAANSLVVLLSIPLFMAMVYFQQRPPDRNLRVLQAGFSVFLLFVVYTNLVGLGLIAGNARLEFIGFIVLLSCLGDIALRRTQHNEDRLLSLNKELEIARNIQAQLLPQPVSTLAELVIASRYVPAGSVAGDFYDFLVKDGALGVLIADVSGHGIPAALSASMVKVAIRAQLERAEDPALVLKELNTILSGNLQGQFVTAGYLFVDPGNRMLAYAGAGHPPLLVWREQTKKVESIEENGLFLGVFPDAQYTAAKSTFGPGARCLLYTDGILEAPNPAGEEFGAERLQDFLAQHPQLTPEQFCDALAQTLVAWCGRNSAPEQHDDLTMVVVDFVAVEKFNRNMEFVGEDVKVTKW